MGTEARRGAGAHPLALVAGAPLVAAVVGVAVRASNLGGWTLGVATPSPWAFAWLAAAAVLAHGLLARSGRGGLGAGAARVAFGALWVLALLLLVDGSSDGPLGVHVDLAPTRRRGAFVALVASLALESYARAARRAPRAAPVALALGAAALGARAWVDAAPLVDEPPPAAPAASGLRPIVLVTLDTTRRDALGCYGADARATPHLDAFARGALRFAHAVSPSPHTHPAMASLLTGRTPLEHGSLSGAPFLRGGLTTLAEHCAGHGYATAGFLDNPWLYGGFGLERGYARLERRTDLARIDAWLGEHAGRPFLLHVHLFAPHGPYELRPEHDAVLRDGAPLPPAAARVGREVDANTIRAGEVPLAHDWTVAEIAWMRAIQASEVRAMDAWIGALFARLEARGAGAVVVVAADHGEEFGERGGLHHSHTLFGELVDVPLLIAAPGLAPGVEDAVVSLTNVADRVCALAGLPALTGAGDAQGAAVSVRVRQGGRHLLRAREGRWALHARVVPGFEPLSCALFDVMSDPGELRDVAPEHPDVVARLLADEGVARALEALRRLPIRPTASAAPSIAVARDLGELGYGR